MNVAEGKRTTEEQKTTGSIYILCRAQQEWVASYAASYNISRIRS